MKHRRQGSSLYLSVFTTATLNWEKPGIAASNNMTITTNQNWIHAANNKMALGSLLLHTPNYLMISIRRSQSASSLDGSSCTMHTRDRNFSPVIKPNDSSQPKCSVPRVHLSCFCTFRSICMACMDPILTDLQTLRSLLDDTQILIDYEKRRLIMHLQAPFLLNKWSQMLTFLKRWGPGLPSIIHFLLYKN